MRFILLTVFFVMLGAVAATPTPTYTSAPEIQTIYQFPDTFVENLFVQSDGKILVSLLTSNILYQIDPENPGHAAIVHVFEEAHALTGIVEYEPDVYVVLAGNYTYGTPNYGAGTWALWSLDLSGTEAHDGTIVPAPRISKIGLIPDAGLLNAVSILSEKNKTVLVDDTKTGAVFRVSLETGASTVVFNNTLTSPLETVHGINGQKIRGGFYYFTNSGQNTLVKVPINDDGTPAGDFVIIAQTDDKFITFDDFAIDSEGNFYISTESGNSILVVSADGTRQTVLAGTVNSTDVAEPSAAAFGRGSNDKNILYVTTSGGFADPIGGNITVPGAVIGIRTRSRVEGMAIGQVD